MKNNILCKVVPPSSPLYKKGLSITKERLEIEHKDL